MDSHKEIAATAIIDSILKNLECHICNEQMYDPVTLQCGDTFCRGCVEAITGNTWSCPDCMEEIKFLVPIQAFNDLMEKLQLLDGMALENLKSLVDVVLTCTICKGLFKDPRTIACSHTFCEDCILNWRIAKDCCPICHEDISECNTATSLGLTDIVHEYILARAEKSRQDRLHQARRKPGPEPSLTTLILQIFESKNRLRMKERRVFIVDSNSLFNLLPIFDDEDQDEDDGVEKGNLEGFMMTSITGKPVQRNCDRKTAELLSPLLKGEFMLAF